MNEELDSVDKAAVLFDPYGGDASTLDPEFAQRVADGERVLNELFGEGTGHKSGPRTRVVRLALSPGAPRLAISFAGNTKYFACPQALGLYPACHVLMLRDPFRCFSMTGIPYLGDDYETTVASIRRMVERLAVPQTYLLGASAGGYAALRYAVDLGADGVLGLSAPTTLEVSNDPEGSTAKYPQLATLYRRARHMAQDLVPLYRQRPRPRVILVYSTSQARDTWLASRMNGIRGVRLFEAPEEAGHRTLVNLTKSGEIEVFLRRLFALTALQ